MSQLIIVILFIIFGIAITKARRSLAHTAHYTTSVKVHYPWHPLYGQEVKVWGRHEYLGESYHLIALPDNSRVLMPVWMADENYCRHFTRQDSPVVSLEALRELTHLLKAVAS